MERENNYEEDGSGHEEREIPVASPSTGLQKRPRSSPTCLTPRQCQKRVPLREVQLTSTWNSTRLEPRRLSYQCTNSTDSIIRWTSAF